MKKFMLFFCITLTLSIEVQSENVSAVSYPGIPPGKAMLSLSNSQSMLRNDVLEYECRWDEESFSLRFRGLESGTNTIKGNTPFILKLADGRVLDYTDFMILDNTYQTEFVGHDDAHRLVKQFNGSQMCIPMRSRDGKIEVLFTALLHNDSNYVIQQVSITSPEEDLDIDTLTLLDLQADGAQLMGETQGAPVAAENLFFAYENPMSEGRVENGRVVCAMQRGYTLKAGETLTQSCVLGVTPENQLRRGFLYYVERERAHPYRPFLHYNSWYDIAWGDRKFNEAQSLEAITIFGEELYEKRGVALQSFVFDDGWDDNKTLWQFHEGFPNGFTPLRDKARQYKSAVGTWLSPFGGYGEAREQRLLYGREQGYETNDSGFSMVGRNYYARFKAICEEMIRDYGVNFFKFDGMGAGLEAGARGSRKYLGDVEALMHLTDELRVIAPDIYISATTGTWPSPYFLWHADNIWRGAGDMGFSGEGSKRQQWINYRDTWTYRNIVQKGPLYPLNALMTQGIVQANHGMAAELGDDDAEMADEIWSFFGSGTSLQELYIAPALLNAAKWDTLAQGAAWAKDNAAILADTHWVGGDPGDNVVYGWASWTPGKAILVLRNPSSEKNTITLDIGKVLEIPDGMPNTFRMSTPRQDQRELPESKITAGSPYQFELDAFEVLVLELIPEQQ